MKSLHLVLALCVASWLSCPADLRAQEVQVKGRIFEPKIDPKEPLFFYRVSRSTNGSRETIETRYTDRNDKPVVEEVSVYESGKLVSYSYKQNQTDENGTILIQDGKVHYTFNAEGKTETDSEDLEENMLVADKVPPFVVANWAQLMNDDSVKFRFLLLERTESIGFKVFKDKEREWNGRKVIDITMKPSSIFIAAIAPSIRLTFEAEPPHRMVESFGRLPVRVAKINPPKSRGDWHAIDGLMELEAPVELVKASAIKNSAKPKKSKKKEK